MGSTDKKRTSEKRVSWRRWSNSDILRRGDLKGLGMRQVKHGANSSGLVDCPTRFETVRELLCCHQPDRTSSAVPSYGTVIYLFIVCFFFRKCN